MLGKSKKCLLFFGICASSVLVMQSANYLPSYKVTVDGDTNRLVIKNKAGEIISSAKTVEHPTSVEVRGDRAYVISIPSALMQEFDISDITNPQLLKNIPQ